MEATADRSIKPLLSRFSVERVIDLLAAFLYRKQSLLTHAWGLEADIGINGYFSNKGQQTIKRAWRGPSSLTKFSGPILSAATATPQCVESEVESESTVF